MDPMSFLLMAFFLGVIFTLPFLPCVWLSLGRASGRRRATVGLAMLGVIFGGFAAIDLDTGIYLATHLVVASCILLGWRHLAYQRMRFTLAALFLATFVLAVALALAVPAMQSWLPSSTLDWPAVLISLAIVAPAPTLLCWASVSFKRRLWVVPFVAVGNTVFLVWLSDGPGWWLGIGMFLVYQAGYALGLLFFVDIYLRDHLIIFREPTRRERWADSLTWCDLLEDRPSGEV